MSLSKIILPHGPFHPLPGSTGPIHAGLGPVEIFCEAGQVSDGYHTFDELYEHRNRLFLALMRMAGAAAWFSKKHHDGTEIPGFFIAGINFHDEVGTITYHLPLSLYKDAQIIADGWEVLELEKGMEWDGHTSAEVLSRLKEFPFMD